MKNIVIKYAFIAMLAVLLANCGKDSDSLVEKDEIENSADTKDNNNSNGSNGNSNGGNNNSGNTTSSILGTWYYVVERTDDGKEEVLDDCNKKSNFVFTDEVRNSAKGEKFYIYMGYYSDKGKGKGDCLVESEIKAGYKILSSTKLMKTDYIDDGTDINGTKRGKEVGQELEYVISGDTLTLKGKTLEDGIGFTVILKKKK